MVVFLLVYSTAILAYMQRICEQTVLIDVDKNTGLGSYFNSIWVTIITMTTVGYGDISPTSNIGRVVGVITALWGAIVTSLFVIVLFRMIELEGNDERNIEMITTLTEK